MMDREKPKFGPKSCVLLVNLLASPETAVNLSGFIWPYGAHSTMHVLRDLAGGDAAKLRPYGECNQPGKPHAESSSKGTSATACFGLKIVERENT